ncbi:MAG TPA: aminopeptidase N [Streptosporangiaceae bacterium]|nr:aminopeptidase N [Streptosporangiaceae bacterium]
MTSNLTRDEATERARLLRVESYRVDLDLTGGELTFGSVVTVRFSCQRPGSASFIDLTAPEVSEAVLNGRKLPADSFDGNRVALDQLAESNELTVRAQCSYSRHGEGLHRFTDPTDKGVYLYTDLETFDAHRVYACFDQPDLKATFEFTVRCPDTWQVISNMAADISGQPAGPGVERWHFPPTPPMSTYITHISAGPYHVVRSEHDGIPLGIFCRQSLASYLDPGEIFEVTRQGFDYYHAAFGVRYPFGKYDQLFVPEYKSGAMENAGAVTFLEDFIFRSRVTDAQHEARAETILHEMAHMWFGDLVTMRWWDDLWLNESFATWASLVALTDATRWPHAWTTFTQAWKAWAYRQDQLPSTHPIAADIIDIDAVEVNFDGITYAKGASVLRQLVAYVGSENFLSGVRTYFGDHAWGNATLGDLLDALARASGRDLAAWSKAWLEAAGVNTLRAEFQTAADGTFTEFAVLQEAPASHPVLRPHRIAIGLYERGPDGLARRRRVEVDVAGERTEVPELAGERLPDLVLVNDDDLTFTKIRLDEHSLRTLISSIGEFTDSLPAALCWAAAWDMCRDAELAARDYLALVLSGLPTISDISMLQTLLRQAIAALRRFADPGWRQTGLAQFAGALRTLLFDAVPGSDVQLAFAQSLASVATSDADLALLSGLLDGSATIDGLAVDTDLRWQLLHRLVSRGVAGQDAIDAEHDRDRTDAGQRHALNCQAAIPSPQAKEAAWSQIVSGDLPNASFRAALGGFYAADQDELVAPFAPRFFDVVAEIWRDWSVDMAQYFAEVGYPKNVVTQDAVDAAADYITTTRPPAALGRLLSEGRDDVARALRCRERDAQAG